MAFEAVRAGELPGEDAPGVLQHPDASIGRQRFDALLEVDLVEAERRHPRLRGLEADMRREFPHGGQVRQTGRVVDEVPERDQGVRLSPAVVDGDLPVCLVAPPRQPKGDLLDQLAQIPGRVGEGEEFRRVLVDRPPALPGHDIVEIGGEGGEGKLRPS